MEAQGIDASGQQRSWVQNEVTIWTLYADCVLFPPGALVSPTI